MAAAVGLSCSRASRPLGRRRAALDGAARLDRRQAAPVSGARRRRRPLRLRSARAAPRRSPARPPPPSEEREERERARENEIRVFQGAGAAVVFVHRGRILSRRIRIRWCEAAGRPVGQMDRCGAPVFSAQAQGFGPGAHAREVLFFRAAHILGILLLLLKFYLYFYFACANSKLYIF